MAKNNYWRRRAINFEEEWHNRCQKTVEKELAAHYQKALGAIQEDILKLYGTFAKDNGLDFDEARKVLQGREFKQWRMTLQEYLQKISDGDKGLERELNTLAMRPRITRLEKLYSETLQELDKLGREVDKSLKDFLSEAYKENYHRNIFDLVKVGGLSVAISKLDNLSVEKVLASRWSGKNFSQRVWTNTKLLGKVLKDTLANGVHRGLSIPQMSRMVEDKMQAGYRNSVRLVRTEMNFVNNQAHADSMADAGVAAYEFIATLDNRTSAACRTRDGETYLLEEKSVGFNYPPLHPRCRSTVCPFIEGVSKKGTRTAKVGGKNIDIPAAMNYTDYKKVYVDKTQSLDQWKNNLNKSVAGGKIKMQSKNQLQVGDVNGNMVVDNGAMKLTKRQELIKSAEDKAFATVTDSDFGFKKMVTMPDWAKELSIVNKVKDVVGLERLINCQRCAVAHEARMRGYDVIARPSWGFDDNMLKVSNWLSAFEYSVTDIRKCSGQTVEEVVNSLSEVMKSFGEGARSIVQFEWRDVSAGSGHVIVSAHFENGSVNFGDPQDGSRAAINKLKDANFGKVYILRIDNLNFTNVVKRCCMNRGENL